MTALKIIPVNTKTELQPVGYSVPKEWIVAGEPQEFFYAALEDTTGVVGIWEAKAGTWQIDSYPTYEFCLVLEGYVLITDSEGHQTRYGINDAFVIPKGFSGTWEMPEGMKKYIIEFGRSTKAKS
jgi:uncharacterized protein